MTKNHRIFLEQLRGYDVISAHMPSGEQLLVYGRAVVDRIARDGATASALGGFDPVLGREVRWTSVPVGYDAALGREYTLEDLVADVQLARGKHELHDMSN